MARIDLEVPYLTQLDNLYEPLGTCNTTSVAMVMKYYGVKGDGSELQLEDQLTKRCWAKGLDRHSPTDLVKLFEWKKLNDRFTASASWDEVRQWLTDGNPCIVHGYFTRSGHIVVIRGFDDAAYNGRGAFIINDPNGEWNDWGYEHGQNKGKAVLYSYSMMQRLCSPDGQLWIHFCSK